jgi:hypothetical protein
MNDQEFEDYLYRLEELTLIRKLVRTMEKVENSSIANNGSAEKPEGENPNG